MEENAPSPTEKTTPLSQAQIAGLAFVALVFFVLPWTCLGYFSLLVNLLSLAALFIFISRRFDFTIPIFGEFLKREYFAVKFKICAIENDREKFGGKICFFTGLKLKFYNFSLKILYYLTLLFKSSADSFSVLQEDLRKKYCQVVFVNHASDDAAVSENFTIKKLADKIRRGEKIDGRVLRKLNDLFYKLHNKEQRRISAFSLFGLSILIIGTVITGLTTSFFFSGISSTMAATFNWTQTDWSGGESVLTAAHATDQTGWTKYSSSSNNIATSTELTIKSTSIISGNANVDFAAEENYTQQDATSGTDFGSGAATLHNLSITATGGTITNSGGYTIHTFTSSGTFATTNGNVEVLVVAGGGGGGGYYYGGGGGGGGVIYNSSYAVTAGNITVTVGDGGAGGAALSRGTSGSNSVFGTLTAVGGGGGGANTATGLNGGSGGGASGSRGSAIAGGSGTTNQGYAGGNTTNADYDGNYSGAAGGGGGGGVGQSLSGTYGTHGGNGGIGFLSSISGASTYYAGGGGGGGGSNSSGTGGTGGLGGGGNGANAMITSATAGAANTGGGGGGGQHDIGSGDDLGRAGGSGVVIVRYLGTNYPVSQSYYITTAAASQLNTSAWSHIASTTITQTTPANTTIKYLVSFDNRSTWKYFDGAAWQSTTLDNTNLQTYGMDKTALEAITQVQWEASGGFISGSTATLDFAADLKTTDASATPSLDNIRVNYLAYPYLISSPYDSADASNVLAGVSWTQDSSLPTGAGVNIYLRASSTADLMSSTDWTQVASTTAAGFITSGCTNASGAVTCTSEVIPADMKDAAGDRWVQYKIELISSGLTTPSLSDITVVYVVNASPEARNVTASQGANGAVTVNYEMRDMDTAVGSPANRYKATVTLQYCTANCSSAGNETWADAAAVTGNAGADLPIAADWSAVKTITWTPATDYANQYNGADFKIRVKINDKEGANNLGYGESAIFTLDTKTPVLGAQPILVNATTTPATLTLSAADDSAMTMTIGLQADLAGATPVAYAATSSISLATDPDTVYVKFTDAYGNATIIRSATTPAKPASVMVQDISSAVTSEFRLFLAWAVASEPFSQYQVYRSSDGVNYSLLATISDRATNYYVDYTTAQNILYYYKFAVKDPDGNISNLSPSISAKANGAQDYGEGGGGTAVTPVISNVASSAISTTQATITWDTDNLSNSQVFYMTSTGGDFSSAPMVGLATMANNSAGLGAHSVTLTGLNPATTYYYTVKSNDINDNTASSTSGVNGYSFATLSGPAISAVATSSVGNTSAVITWTTDTAGDTSVFYSTSALMANPIEITKNESTTNHSVSLADLSVGTAYYFYVKTSVATDNNGGNYYGFTTTSDVTAPNLYNISASPIYDTVAVISWETNESSDSTVLYGMTDALGATVSSATTTIEHSLALTGLTANNTYYYKVRSIDAAGNQTLSALKTFDTLETLSTESQVQSRETAAKASGSGGGGVLIVNTGASSGVDRTPPLISEVRVSDLTAESAVVSWKTDKAGDSIVEYGLTSGYGSLGGQRVSSLNHQANLKNLEAGSLYNYRVSSIDANGNMAQTANQTFTTPSALDEASAAAQKVRDIELLSNSQEKENVIVAAAKTAMDIIGQAAGEVSLNTLETTLNDQYNFIEKLAKVIPAPLLSGEPKVIATAYTATVAWRTNKEANSLVAYSGEDNFKMSSGDGFSQVVGDSDAKTVDHVVNISELKPDTTYVYQVRSKLPLGPLAKSDNFSFRTRKEALEISNYVVQNVSNEKAIFKWVTSVDTDAALKYTPYRNNALAVDETKIKLGKDFSPIHEITADDLEGGTIYQVELSGKDQKGDKVSKIIPTFSTSNDDLPPIIFQVQSSSAINQGKRDTIQTVISWMTNEPATSKVYYVKGLGKESDVLSGASQLDLNFTKKHVAVITRLEPGSIYRFMVESRDSTDNITQSKIYTILTPRQQETVFDVIKKNFSDVFSWTSRVGK